MIPRIFVCVTSDKRSELFKDISGGNDIFVEVAVAGLSKEDLDIELADGILSISYKRINNEKNEQRCHRLWS